jgi:hypothetical protein
MQRDIQAPLPERIEAQGFQLSVTDEGWRQYCEGDIRMDELLVHDVRINGGKPLVVCVCDAAPGVDCAYGSRGWPAGLPRAKVPEKPDLALLPVKATVESAIGVELLHLHASDGQYEVSAETIYDLLMQNLGGKWVRAYIGASPPPELTAAIVKCLQTHASSQSTSMSRLRDVLKGKPTPDVPSLFVGQGVWARWLGESARRGTRVEGPWCRARVLGKGEAAMDNGDRTYTLYFDVDQQIHKKTPLRHRSADVISTTERS